MERHFFIICLKRSRFVNSEVSEYTSDWFNQCELIYWKPNRQGYTWDQAFAGRYTLDDVKECAGAYLDWFLVPCNQYLEDEV
jgi:hypothetical protein